MTDQDKEIAIQTVKDILHVLHEKRYEDLTSCVDEMEWNDTKVIRECIQGTLDMNGFDTFDEYDVPCNFHPRYEYHHKVEFYDGIPAALMQSMTLPLVENWSICVCNSSFYTWKAD